MNDMHEIHLMKNVPSRVGWFLQRMQVRGLKSFTRCLLLGLGLLVLAPLVSRANDDIFPPSSDAAPYSNFDGRGFIINGKRVFITSGSIHFARVPRANWRDILLKLKRSGFNTVETYVFWNYHEAHEGQFDFTTENRDLGAFLDVAKQVGLYAIVRVGPYSCAEWANGGFPTWLYFKPDLTVRGENKAYLACVDDWFNKMLPIVAQHQINKGGNVILVQLENEHPANWSNWGTQINGPYFQHLLDLAHQNGLEIPMYFSGLHHDHDPAPNPPVEHINRKSPWFSSELWTTWYDRYGNSGNDLKDDERHPWRVLAEEGNGFNLYMFHGGTNFDYFNDYEDTASYDYGTLIGQAGDTREIYLRLKRLAYFAETFSPILAGSDNATSTYQDFAQGVSVTAQTAPNGSIVFLDNKGGDTTATLKSGTSIKMIAGEIIGLPVQVPLATGLTLAEGDTRILGIVPQGHFTTLVCFGETGDKGKIMFGSLTPATGTTVNDAGFGLDSGSNPTLAFTFPEQGVGEEDVAFGATNLRVLVMNKETADKTWFVDTAAGRQIVIGAPYLGEFTLSTTNNVQLTVDYPWNDPAPTELTLYGQGTAAKIPLPASSGTPSSSTLKLTDWEMSPDTAPLAGNYDDQAWFTLPDGSPPEMGQDGDNSAYAWYRVHLSNSPGADSITCKWIADSASFFLDGKLAGTFDIKTHQWPDPNHKVFTVPVQIPPGDHDLAVFTSLAGREKYYNYTGGLDYLEAQKGVRGPVTYGSDASSVLTGWKMSGGVDPADPHLAWSAAAATAGAPAYYRTHIQLDSVPDPGAVYRLATTGLSAGSVWLNGHNLGRYPEILKDCPGIWLPTCWMKAGDNSLVVFDEQGHSPDQTSVQLEQGASRHRLTIGAP
jgi:beta-galactosidase